MSRSFTGNPTIHKRSVELLQNLIRFDTTNPPGNEAECVAYINHLLTEAGFLHWPSQVLPHPGRREADSLHEGDGTRARYTPMNLPAEFNFTKPAHAADERIPVEAIGFGTNAVYEVLQRYER